MTLPLKQGGRTTATVTIPLKECDSGRAGLMDSRGVRLPGLVGCVYAPLPCYWQCCHPVGGAGFDAFGVAAATAADSLAADPWPYRVLGTSAVLWFLLGQTSSFVCGAGSCCWQMLSQPSLFVETTYCLWTSRRLWHCP